MQTLWHAAKGFLFSDRIGIVVGMFVLGLVHLHIHSFLFLGLAPGLFARLGMPPFSVLLFHVCFIKSPLYGIIGPVWIVSSQLRFSGPPEPAIIKKADE